MGIMQCIVAVALLMSYFIIDPLRRSSTLACLSPECWGITGAKIWAFVIAITRII